MRNMYVLQNQDTCEFVTRVYPLSVSPEISGCKKFFSWSEAAQAAQNTGPEFEIIEYKPGITGVK